MCLAIPMEIVAMKDDHMATVSASGATRDVALELTPDAKIGDYVLVHAGFAIEVVSAEFADETLSLIQEMADMVDDPLFNPAAAEEVCTIDGPHAAAPAVSAEA